LYIVVSVLVLHALALWGLQSGLLQRAAAVVQELVVPASVITESPVVAQPAPQSVQPVAPAKATPAAVAAAPTPVATPPVPVPQAVADATPAANAATGVQHAPATPFAPAAPAAQAVAPGPAPVPKPEQPSAEAEYLVSPSREYPLRCWRRREQGRVVVRVLIGADGNAEKVELGSSSGSECLNREALATAMAAKYKPVMRGGVAVQAWRDASYKYVLPE
jgi:protein TonB